MGGATGAHPGERRGELGPERFRVQGPAELLGVPLVCDCKGHYALAAFAVAAALMAPFTMPSVISANSFAPQSICVSVVMVV